MTVKKDWFGDNLILFLKNIFDINKTMEKNLSVDWSLLGEILNPKNGIGISFANNIEDELALVLSQVSHLKKTEINVRQEQPESYRMRALDPQGEALIFTMISVLLLFFPPHNVLGYLIEMIGILTFAHFAMAAPNIATKKDIEAVLDEEFSTILAIAKNKKLGITDTKEILG